MADRIGIIRIIILLSAVSLAQTSMGQVPFKKHAALSVASTSSYVESDHAVYRLQQSVGQPGVTGVVSSHGLLLRQGFIQPPLRSSSEAIAPPSVQIFPNPFSDELIIDLPPGEAEGVLIVLTDVLGREIFSQHFSSSSIRIGTASMGPGQYILKVMSHRQYIVKLIKE